MLEDPRSAAFLDRFVSEWLGLEKLATIMSEESLYKRFDSQGTMRQDFAGEPMARTVLFFDTISDGMRSVRSPPCPAVKTDRCIG